MPEGDSGLVRHTLTEERLEAYSAWFSLPTSYKTGDIPRDVVALAKHFGVSAKSIEDAKRRPDMVKRVAERLHAAAVYGMPDILWNMIGKAADSADKEAPKAARFVAEIAGVIRSGSAVQVNNTVVTPTMDLSDDALITAVEDIARRRVIVPPRNGAGPD